MRYWLFMGLLVVAGLLFSVWLYLYLAERAKHSLNEDFDALVDQRIQALDNHYTRSLEALYGLAAYLSEDDNRQWQRFRDYVDGSLQRLPELQALEWIPIVSRSQRNSLEANAAVQGLGHFRIMEFDGAGQLRPASERDHYYPVLYAYPENVNVEAIGLDLGSQPDRLAAIQQSLTLRSIVATAPVRLAQEKVNEVYGVLIFAPVVSGEQGQVDGFALAVYRSVDLLSSVFADLAERGIWVDVRDAQRDQLSLYSNHQQPLQSSPLFATRQFDLGYRSWSVGFSAGPEYLQTKQQPSVFLYPLIAALMVLAFGFHSVMRIRQILEVEQQVSHRTRALTEEVQNRRDAEAAAHKAEQRYRSIFENAIDGIFQSTVDGRYLAANSALAHIYGYRSAAAFMEEMCNIETQLYVEPGRRKDFIEIMQRDGKVNEFISEVYKKDGNTIWILEKALSVYGPDGLFLYYEGNVQDITNRIHAENALQKNTEWLEQRVQLRTAELAKINAELQEEVRIRQAAEQFAASANKAKTQFLANMSHEIRTPLNAIIGYSQILQQQTNLNDQQNLAIRTIAQSGDHLLALIDDILDLSKIESGHLELQNTVFDLASSLTNVAYIVRKKCEEKTLELKVEGLGNKPVWVEGDEIKLRQVLINLLSNAVKYTDHGEVILRVIPEDNHDYRFEIIDTGPGIPAEELTKIFNQFYQRSDWKDGTGLGLSIASRIIKAMGNELKVQSKPGMGSNFFFRLHFNHASEKPLVDPDILPQHLRLQQGQKCLVMVVDDIQHNRDILRLMLQSIGCEVITAESGEKALEYLSLQSVDILFLDILMPQPDGFATRRLIAEQFPDQNAPIIAFSAAAYEEQKQQYLAEGFNDVISKPFRMDQLYYCLSRHLNLTFESVELGVPEPLGFDLQALSLSSELKQRLLAAARIYNITRLRETLQQIASLSPQHQQLARYLRLLSDKHRLADLITLIEGLSCGDENGNSLAERAS